MLWEIQIQYTISTKHDDESKIKKNKNLKKIVTRKGFLND